MAHLDHADATVALPKPGTIQDHDGMTDDRSDRARTESMVVAPVASPDAEATGLYHVTGESGDTYLVDLAQGRCGCPDHKYRDETCKHLRRVAMQTSETLLPTPGDDATLYYTLELPLRLEQYEAAHDPDAPEYVAHHLDILRDLHETWLDGDTPSHPGRSFPNVDQ